MFDESTGWGISEDAILRTVDGGVEWLDVSPPTIGVFGYAATSCFLDSLRGWVLVPDGDNPLSGILSRTSDGGAHWNQSPAPFGSGQLRFLDSRQGWMMASLGAGAGSMAVAVYQTQDAGVNWTRVYTNDPGQPGAGESLALGGLKNGISPVSMQQAWIGGVTYRPGTLYLYETRDGGHSWHPSSITAPAGYQLAELETTGPEFINARTAHLPVHLSSPNGVMLAVYTTRDGGATWLLPTAYVAQGGPIDFISEETGFTWNGTDFYVTNDSAKSWETITPDVDFTGSFAGMDFVDAHVGFLLSDRGNGRIQLYKTLDAGATWNTVK